MDEVAPDARSDERCPRCDAPIARHLLRCPACDLPLVAPAELPVGALLADGRYQVLAVIGRGGFGITYEAGDTRLQRRVAIKELFPDTAVRHGSQVLTPAAAREAFRAARERFLREARVLARFTQPGIVRVYEVFEEHGTAYLVMELLGGCPLVDVLRTRGEPFAEPEVLDVAGRVAAALRPVHAAGVLHRDLNPSNVMLTEHGRIVLIDFGLARDFDQEQTMGMTRVVTPGYAPLEQYRGEGRFGPSTDVYGLAATLYRLATGRIPAAAVARDAGSDLVAVHRANPAISKRVSDAIGDGLELEPTHRPQDLDSFLARLGIRQLPDGPRSVLLGSPGAEPERLRAASGTPLPAPPVPPVAPAPMSVATEVVAPAPAAAPPHAVPAGADADCTVHVAPGTFAASAPPPGPPAPNDATRPAALAGAPVDGDATRPAAGPVATEVLAGAEPVGAPPPAPGEPSGLGRRKLTVPLAVLGVAVASAAPVLVVALLVLVVLPAIATLGDLTVRRLRVAHGLASGWAETRAPRAGYAAARFLRNVVASVLRCSPVVGLGAVLLGLWYLVASTSVPLTVDHLLLRVVGGGTAWALLAATAQGSNRFRTGFGIDRLVAVAVPEGRTSERVVIGWIVMAMIAATALWLDPTPFPLPLP